MATTTSKLKVFFRFPFYINGLLQCCRSGPIFTGSGSESAEPVLKIRIRTLLRYALFNVEQKITKFKHLVARPIDRTHQSTAKKGFSNKRIF